MEDTTVNSFTPQKLKETVQETPTIHIGDCTYMKVVKYKGDLYINIRDYVKNPRTGLLNAGRRGILLKPEEWKNLKRHTKDIDRTLKQK